MIASQGFLIVFMDYMYEDFCDHCVTSEGKLLVFMDGLVINTMKGGGWIKCKYIIAHFRRSIIILIGT